MNLNEHGFTWVQVHVCIKEFTNLQIFGLQHVRIKLVVSDIYSLTCTASAFNQLIEFSLLCFHSFVRRMFAIVTSRPLSYRNTTEATSTGQSRCEHNSTSLCIQSITLFIILRSHTHNHRSMQSYVSSLTISSLTVKTWPLSSPSPDSSVPSTGRE